jgi:hypothetical protein
MILFGYKISMWRIVFISLLFCIAAFYYFMPSAIEAFTSGTGKEAFDQLIGCPAIKNSITTHKKLLEGYTERDAVVSAQSTREVLELFTKSYTEHDCESYLIKNPVKAVKEVVEEAIKDTVKEE